MQRQEWKLFPTLVVRYREVLAPAQLQLILQHCLRLEAREHRSLLGDARSSFDRGSRLIATLEAEHDALKGLGAGLGRLMDEYARELGFDGARLSNSWFNVQRPGSVLRHHTHPDARVSAALCIASDENSSKLFFENPNALAIFAMPEGRTDYNMDMARFSVVPGDLILFPSWLKHGSGFEANASELRVMISINAEA